MWCYLYVYIFLTVGLSKSIFFSIHIIILYSYPFKDLFFVQLWFLIEYFLSLFPSNNDLQSLRKTGILCVNQSAIISAISSSGHCEWAEVNMTKWVLCSVRHRKKPTSKQTNKAVLETSQVPLNSDNHLFGSNFVFVHNFTTHTHCSWLLLCKNSFGLLILLHFHYPALLLHH